MLACAGCSLELGQQQLLAAGGASGPGTAVDVPSGVAFVAWVQAQDHGANVYISRLEDGSAPSAPVRVNDVAGDATPSQQATAQVVLGPEGNLYVAWPRTVLTKGNTSPSTHLRFARSTDGGHTFTSAITVNEDASGPPASHSLHDLVVTSDGVVVIAWLDTRHPEPPPPTEAPPGGETLGSPNGSGGPSASAPTTAAGAATGGVRPAPDVRLPGSDVRVAVSRDQGVSFELSRIADVGACPCCRVELAAGSDGALYVAWRKLYEGDVRDVVVARSSDGGATWATPSRVHDDGWVFSGCPQAAPALAVGADGVLHVAWYTGKEGAAGVFRATSTDGGRFFSEPEALSLGEASPAQVELSVSRDGRLWAAWESRGGAGTVLLGEGRPQAARAPSVTGQSPSLGGGGEGALLAWLRGDSVFAVRAIRQTPLGTLKGGVRR